MTSLETILLFGGNGKTGRAITKTLAKEPSKYIIHSTIRNPDQSSTISSLGATPVHCDLESIPLSDLTSLIQSINPSLIIWAAGASPGSSSTPDAIDNLAAIKSFDAAEAAVPGVRYISISALDVRDRAKDVPPWYNDMNIAGSERLWKAIGAFMESKLKSDSDLARRGTERLKWTIVRPGRLMEDAGVGRVKAGHILFGKGISREDVAAIVVACLKEEGTIGMAFDVVGGDDDVREEVSRVVKDDEDCFRGYF